MTGKTQPGRRSAWTLHPSEIHVAPGRNRRRRTEDGRYAKFDELCASILENGIITPLRVVSQDGKYWLTAGHRRKEALDALIADGHDIVAVPVEMDSKYSSEADHLLMQLNENSGVPYSDLENGDTIREYIAFGNTKEMVAQKTGFKLPYIERCLALTYAPPAIQELVASGEIAPTVAFGVIREQGTGPEAMSVLTEAVTVAKAQGRTAATGDDVAAVKMTKAGVDVGAEVERLTEFLGGVPWSVLDVITLQKIEKLVNKAAKKV
jgi:ParB/RepB/Spo0J family partition protein